MRYALHLDEPVRAGAGYVNHHRLQAALVSAAAAAALTFGIVQIADDSDTSSLQLPSISSQSASGPSDRSFSVVETDAHAAAAGVFAAGAVTAPRGVGAT